MGLFCLHKGSLQGSGCMQSTAIHGIVCFVNSFCALLQVANLDSLHFSGNKIAYLRYVEWSLCAPLMTLEVMVSARFTMSQICPILVLTIAFCICGTIAAFSLIFWIKILLGVQGSLYSSIVIYRLWKIALCKQPNINDNNVEVETAIANLCVTSIIWPIYIVTWGLGPDVYGVLSRSQEVLSEQLASIILKMFGLSYALVSSSTRVESIIEFISSVIRSRLTSTQ